MTTNGASRAARLLFVIDNDYGALGTVMYFLYRQPIAASTTLMLPERVFDFHEGQLPVASLPYRSVQDILDVVDRESPDVVCLVSGYLFVFQDLFSASALKKLIDALRQRGCRVATSDPYLGTFRRVASANISGGAGVLSRDIERRLLRHPRVREIAARCLRFYNRKKLERHVRRVADSLRDITHFYPVPMDLLAVGGLRHVSFFNPLYLRSEDELREISEGVSALPEMAGRGKRWLFVVGKFDLELQEKKYGKTGFANMVVGKIRETLANGRHPTFIGPASFVEEIGRHFTADSGVSLLSYCRFEEFQRRLLDAEVVFYWQIFSTSTFLRLWNGLPAFFFDQGHNAHILEPMRKAGLKYYYLGSAPIYLDIDEKLDAAELTEMSAGFRQSAIDSCRRLALLPSPEGMVAAIREAE